MPRTPIETSLLPVAERRISDRAFLGHYIAAVIAGLVVAGLSIVALPAMPPLVLLGALPWLGVWAYAALLRKANSYRLFADRFEVESGLLTRSIENIELFRIRDVGLRQGVVGRLANFGDVILHSTDASSPALSIRAVDAPREFYERIRECVAESRRLNRTMLVENGDVITG